MKICTKRTLGKSAIAVVACAAVVFAVKVNRAAGASMGRGWIAGVEMTFLQPDVEGGSIGFDNGASTYLNTELAELDDMEGAPRIWLGYEGPSGWGYRVRFWDIEVSNAGSDVDLDLPLGLNAESAVAQTRLGATTIDLELTRRMKSGVWNCLAAIGATYADSRVEESLAVNVRADGQSAYTILSRQDDGAGIILSLETTRDIGETGFALYGILRGSFAWGESRNSYAGHLYDPGANLSQGAITELDNTLYILQVQAGLQWSRRISGFHGNVFTRVGVEYQRWMGDDPLQFSFNQTVGAATVSGASLSPDLDFTGLAWSIGITR